MNKNQRYAENN